MSKTFRIKGADAAPPEEPVPPTRGDLDASGTFGTEWTLVFLAGGGEIGEADLSTKQAETRAEIWLSDRKSVV